MSHLSQKLVMSSPIYLFVLGYVNYKIQGFTLDTKPETLHWKNEGGGEIVIISHCNRESNTGETQLKF